MFTHSLFCFALYACLLAGPSSGNGQAVRPAYPKETLHLHTDKESYFPGETIWFKAYLQTGHLPETGSTNLYTSLVDGGGHVLASGIWPVFNAAASGSMAMPDSLPPSGLFISAYTPTMLAENADTAFSWQVPLVGGHSLPAQAASPKSVSFYPEGGSLVPGASNYIVFGSLSADGLACPAKAVIKNGKGVIIDSVSSMPNGMGLLKLIPEPGESYFADWESGGSPQQTPLPAANAAAVALHVEEVGGQLYYVVESPAEEGPAELFATAIQGSDTVYSAKLNMAGRSVLSGKIPLDSLPNGILWMAISNKNGQLLAGRHAYANPQRLIGNAMVSIIKKDLTPRGLNTLEISIPDTLQTDLSLSVFDAGFGGTGSRYSILSDLMIPAAEFGYLPNVGDFLPDGTKEKNKALDWLMLANPKLRHPPDPVAADAGKLPENYITVHGVLTDERKRPLPNEELVMIASMPDSSKNWYTVNTGNKGEFQQAGFVFNDSATVFFKLKNTKIDLEKTTVTLLRPTLPAVRYTPAFKVAGIPAQSPEDAETQKQVAAFKNRLTKAVELDNVTVKGYKWRNDSMLKLDEKYTSGVFRGGATSYAFDVANDPMTASKYDIYNYMFGKVPGMRIKYEGTRKRIAMGEAVIQLFFIDESEVDELRLEQLDIYSVAYIKYIDRFGSRPGMPNALCIYLKTGNDRNRDLKNLPTTLLKQKIYGYTSPKAFYEPDYANKKAADTTDLRSTLFWVPEIILGKARQKATISFYNNDVSRRLKLVLEGVNEEGKLFRVEKIIE